MKVLVDTNVVLDVLLDRSPYSAASAQIFSLVEQGRLQGLLCATTVTTIDYLLLQSLSRVEARKHLSRLMQLFDVAPVNRAVLEGAMKSRISDFEDAVLEQAAALAGAAAVITRNAKDFAHAGVKILDPAEVLARFRG